MTFVWANAYAMRADLTCYAL